jgi:hypothetical protein
MARGGSGNDHSGKDSRVYMDVGLALGEKRNELLKSKQVAVLSSHRGAGGDPTSAPQQLSRNAEPTSSVFPL